MKHRATAGLKQLAAGFGRLDLGDGKMALLMKIENIQINDRFRKALDLIADGSGHVFVTGKAGTGKSTFLQYLRDTTDKNVAVLAPTGVAAVNIGGQTIHSFFGFKPDITVSKVKKDFKRTQGRAMYQKLDAILIDEISMVRADLLDCVDEFLRMHGPTPGQPFGGVQMIFIGDLYQLPPVVGREEKMLFRTVYDTPYFYSARVFDEIDFAMVELEKIYRQKDERFIEILNAVRNRSLEDTHLEAINSRVDEDFVPPADDLYIYLTPTNRKAGLINDRELARLTGKTHLYHGTVLGDFSQRSLPAPHMLEIRIGAQVMLVNNDRQNRWINGTVGRVVEIELSRKEDEHDAILVELETGEIEPVYPHTWDMYQYFLNSDTNRLDTRTVGAYTQYPIILAWAVTIHKGQGKTFDRVILDLDRGTFAHGQSYVALSRCTSLDGLVLKKPLEKKHVLLDWDVVRFLTDFKYRRAHEQVSVEDKISLIRLALKRQENLKITYLKSNDITSERVVTPYGVGESEYRGKTFIGLEGYCHKRRADRVFRVDRILALSVVDREE